MESLDEEEINQVWDFIRHQPTAMLVVLFVDIANSTRLFETHGEVVATSCHRHLEKSITEHVNSVRKSLLVKFLGDGAFLVFLEPSTAVEWALDLHESLHASLDADPKLPEFRLRFGLDLGQVAVDNNIQVDFFGSHVNKADRIQGCCRIGAVAMSHAVFESAFPRLRHEENLDWRFLGRRALKGFVRRHEVFQVHRRSAHLPSVDGETPLRGENLVGRCIGNYALADFIGAGGYGCVYGGRKVNSQVPVAVRVSHFQPAEYPQLSDVFWRMARCLGALDNASIATLLDFGEMELEGNRRFVLVYELVRGTDIKSYWRPIDSRRKLRRFLDQCVVLCQSLHAAHETAWIDDYGFQSVGVCHGDLKTSNILVTDAGEPKLIDFQCLDYQLFRIIDELHSHLPWVETKPPEWMQSGTQGYMAPEQLREGLLTPRADIYALGRVVLSVLVDWNLEVSDAVDPIELLEESMPFAGRRLIRVLRRTQDPDPAGRYESMGDLAAALVKARPRGVW